MRRTLRLLSAFLLLAAAASAQSTKPFVETLASEKLGGREAGSADERAAGDYLAQQLARMGAKPLPGRSDMFQSFAFTAGSRDAGSRIAVAAGQRAAQTFAAASDVQTLSFSDDAEVIGPAVFAGYGIVVPESQGFGYDSYATLDVKDKVVVVLRYSPRTPTSRRAPSSRATPICATRRWRRASTAPRRSSS